MSGLRVEICGGIATGKTTLAQRLVAAWGAIGVYEDFRRNPFWERFYRDPERYLHEKNVCFLAQHVGELKGVEGGTGPVVSDYASAQDLAYAALAPDPAHLPTMQALYRHLTAAVPAPGLVVHLRCEPALQLERIRRRGRREEDPITVGYLERLNQAIEAMLATPPWACPVVTVDSGTIDFATDDVQAQALSLRLRQAAGLA